MSVTKTASYDAVMRMLADVRAKQANAEKDPGGQEGGSDHPSAHVDNGTITAPEGARAAENTKDVKNDVPASVDAAPEGVGDGKQDSVQLNIGTQQSATGEDPSSETASVNARLPDPGGYEGGTSHPANLDNSSVSQKYSSVRQQIATARELGHALLAKIAMNAETTPAAAPAPAAATLAPPVDKAAAAGEAAAAAAIAAQQQRDVAVVGRLYDTIKLAEDNAARTAEYLQSFFAERRQLTGKTAGDDTCPANLPATAETEPDRKDPQEKDEAGSAGGDDDADNHGGPPDGDADNKKTPAHDPAAAVAAGDAMPVPALTELAGGPDAAAAGGAPSPLGGGHLAGGLAPGGEGQGLDPAMLLQILSELGIPPEALMAASAGKAAAALRGTKPTAPGWAPQTEAQKAAYAAGKQYIQELMGPYQQLFAGAA